MSGDDQEAPVRSPTNAVVDQRVARVEQDLGQLRAEVAGFREVVGERFNSFADVLRRIEAAVTQPNAGDAATAVAIADLNRRMADQESKTSAIATKQTAQEAQLGTVGAGLRWFGFGGVILVIALVAGWVATTGRLP